MKVKLPLQSKLAHARTLRLLGLASAVCLSVSAMLVQAATPPNPMVELRFTEGIDVVTTNTGTLAENAFFNVTDTNNYPGFSTNVPVGAYVPAANSYSVDMGPFTGALTYGRAVDLTNSFFNLGPLYALTICGWVNASDIARDGKIAYALETVGGLGFDLANDSIGRLTLGVNEGSGNNPSVLRLNADPQTGTNNWVFFAVTYDPSLGSNQLTYYFGRSDKLAYLDSAYTYVGGDVTSSNIDFTGPLTVGNYSTVDPNRDTTSAAGSGIFRGLLDEVKIYTNALTLDQVQQAQLNSTVTPVAASVLHQPANKTTPEGQDALFDVDASGSGQLTYQWKTNGVDVAGATNSSFNLSSVTLAQIGLLVRVGVSNSVGGVLSSNATLKVEPANAHLLSSSFIEGNALNTNPTLTPGQQGTILTINAGLLQGRGIFAQKSSTANEAGTWPVFSTNVPSGQYAPNPIFNRYSLHMGDVLYRSDGTFAGSQGSRAVDFTNSVASPANSLGKMSALTICGWINAGSLTWRGTGNFGNQLANAQDSSNANGFGLAHKSDNSLQLAVNESVGGSTANRSSINMIVNDTNHPTANWIFFAVTYDGSLTAANLNFYWGDANNAATNDLLNPLTYDRGLINSTGPFTLGNFNTTTTSTGRTISGENAAFFRGLIEEFHIFSKVLTLTEVQQIQVAPPAPPVLLIAPGAPGNNVLSWAQGQAPLLPALQLQSRTNLTSGSWSDVTNPTNVSGTVRSLSLPASGDAKFFGLRIK